MNNKLGFSLVELSIVLVMLGLLTGGILTGKSLIRASELRSITVDVNQYKTAFNTFEVKYFAKPGDMKNATSFWGDNSIKCSDGNSLNNGNPGTCNGNGNGIINITNTTTQGASEHFMIWNQLALSEIINGNYSGLSGTAGSPVWNGRYHSIIGSNAPEATIPNGTFFITDSNQTGNPLWFDQNYQNDMIFARPDSASGTTQSGIINAEEAWNIDKKIDDGHPATGNVNIGNWTSCTTPITGIASSSNRNVNYKFSNTNIDCALIFLDII